jgi:hypothetical protein
MKWKVYYDDGTIIVESDEVQWADLDKSRKIDRVEIIDGDEFYVSAPNADSYLFMREGYISLNGSSVGISATWIVALYCNELVCFRTSFDGHTSTTRSSLDRLIEFNRDLFRPGLPSNVV